MIGDGADALNRSLGCYSRFEASFERLDSVRRFQRASRTSHPYLCIGDAGFAILVMFELNLVRIYGTFTGRRRQKRG